MTNFENATKLQNCSAILQEDTEHDKGGICYCKFVAPVYKRKYFTFNLDIAYKFKWNIK